jgi:hypothetical protein
MSSAQLYDTIGAAYTVTRRTEPRIAAQVWAALGDARTVLNVGAGTGSYEPTGRDVTAVEPSAVMRAQRPAGAAPCVAATAESLSSPSSRSRHEHSRGTCYRRPGLPFTCTRSRYARLSTSWLWRSALRPKDRSVCRPALAGLPAGGDPLRGPRLPREGLRGWDSVDTLIA